MTMIGKVLIISAVLLAPFGYLLHGIFTLPPLPDLPETWWGRGDPSKQDTSIRPFKISVPPKTLDDLKYRLDHSIPFTAPLEGINHEYGINTDLLQDVVDFWRTEYNWTRSEELLNQFPHFLTNIQGLDIHFLHIKPKAPINVKVLPLLMLHGWPGSFTEFIDLIPLLTKPQGGFVFEVIIGSIPGYGFSEGAVRPGLGPAEIARIFKTLMHRLGYQKFYVQGGDFGSIVLRAMSTYFPENVLGLHNNMCVVNTPLSIIKNYISSFWAEEDKRVRSPILGELGYMYLQSTKPDTIGVALKDSPVGLAAYILEKFIVGTNSSYVLQRKDGGFKEHFGYTKLLDNIMIYWVTRSMPTAIRLYAETFNKRILVDLKTLSHPIHIPTACAQFSNDFKSSEWVLKEIFTNLLQLNNYEGGHFAALQLPELFAKDVFMAVDKFEKYHARKL